MAKSTQTKIIEQINIIQNAYNEVKLLGGSMWVKSPDGTMEKAGELRRAYGGDMSAEDLEEFDFFFDCGGNLEWHS
jgi:hypothetical protein